MGEDRLADQNRHSRYQSWSMAKSVTAMIFGRAMTLGLMSPDDPVGALVPEADKAHGEITVHDLLTMTSGLKWNGLRDYNIFTMPDRVRDALTLEVVKPHGTYFEYAQSAGIAARRDRRPVGGRGHDGVRPARADDAARIEEGSWDWTRDKAGHVGGFYGVRMTPDDYGRLGDLFRRGGVWKGRRLLSREYIRRAVEPSKTNGCYGWLIWLNAAAPCIGPTVADRGIEDGRDFPELPADFYNFSGLFGQRVTVFPTQDIVIVRTGQDPGLVPAGQASWENELYKRVLARDDRPDLRAARRRAARERGERGDGRGLRLRPGAVRARPVLEGRASRTRCRRPGRRAPAPRSSAGGTKNATRDGVVRVKLACPPVWPAQGLSGCAGEGQARGREGRNYTIAPGKAKTLRFQLSDRKQRRAAP